MVKTFFCLGMMVLAAFTASCSRNENPPEEKPASSAADKSVFSVRFPYDLGSPTVNVSRYPKNVQDDYKIFLAVCSSCHTTARPLNSPYASEYDWSRFVQRMHVKILSRGSDVEKRSLKQIMEFLVYDSKVRKVKGKAEFDLRQAELKELFDQVVQKNNELIEEETKKLPKKELPYVGVK